jgi:hypothetical protein
MSEDMRELPLQDSEEVWTSEYRSRGEAKENIGCI